MDVVLVVAGDESHSQDQLGKVKISDQTARSDSQHSGLPLTSSTVDAKKKYLDVWTIYAKLELPGERLGRR